MASTAKDRMVESAVELLARHGYAATSFSELLSHSGAPRGSIYFHFPGGKDEVIAEAIRLQGARAVTMLDRLEGSAAVEVVEAFVQMWRSLLVRFDFEIGCSLVAVTASAPEPDLVAKAGEAFRTWRTRLAELLAAGGLADADGFATLLLASCEGAVVLARAERDLAPFEAVVDQLRARVADQGR